MHISTLYLTSDKAPVPGFSIYIVVDETDRTVRLFHPSTCTALDILHLEFRSAREQELWPNPYDSNPRTVIKEGVPVIFPEQVARMIERRIRGGSIQYSADLVRRIIARLRGLKLDQVPLLKPSQDMTSSRPRGFAVRSEKRPGVIDAISTLLGREHGVTVDEAIEALNEQFPDRGTDGMKTTIRCQLNRLPGKLGRKLISYFDNERGKVYQWEAE